MEASRISRLAVGCLLPLLIIATLIAFYVASQPRPGNQKEITVLKARRDLPAGITLHRVQMPISLLASSPRQLGYPDPAIPLPPPPPPGEPGAEDDMAEVVKRRELDFRKTYSIAMTTAWGSTGTPGPMALEWLSMSNATDWSFAQKFCADELTGNFEPVVILERNAPKDVVDLQAFEEVKYRVLRVGLEEGEVLKRSHILNP